MKQRYCTVVAGKNLLLFSFSLFCFSTVFSQSNTGQSNTSEIKPVHRSMNSSVQNSAADLSDTVSMKQRIRNIDDHLQAIQIKEDYIKSDQEEMRIATETGWFEKMDKVRQELISERALLVEKLNHLH